MIRQNFKSALLANKSQFWSAFWPVTVNLFVSNLKAKYAKSLLGPVWLVLEPALFITITSLVFSNAFDAQIGATPYILFVMPGLLIWSFFFSQTNASPMVFLSHRELITNTTVSKLAIIASKVLMGGVDYLIRQIILLVFFGFYFSSLPIIGLVGSLLVGINLLVLLLGISLLLAVSNTYFRDFNSIVPVVLQLAFYASPVIYPISVIPAKWSWVAKFNPLAQMIEFLRLSLFQQSLNLTSLVIFSSWTLAISVLAMLIYKKFGAKLAEEL